MQQLPRSVFYFRYWKRWVLATVLRLTFLACLPILILSGIIGDRELPIVDVLYPEDLWPLLVGGITGESHGMSGEFLGFLVLLDTPIVGYLLTVIWKIGKLRRANKNGASDEPMS